MTTSTVVRMSRRNSWRHAVAALRGRLHVTVSTCPACGHETAIAAGEDPHNFMPLCCA